MNVEDIKALSAKTREDGQRLFGVCEVMYIISMIGIVLFGLVGVVLATFIGVNINIWAGVGFGVITLLLCLLSYMIAVLSTHLGKVAVHTSFASVGLLEHFANQ